MANTSSAKKAARKMLRRTEINKSRASRSKPTCARSRRRWPPATRRAAKGALAAAEPILMRTAQKGVIHKNAASRKVSRLAARVRAMA